MTESAPVNPALVRVHSDTAEITRGGAVTEHRIGRLPLDFLAWQMAARQALFRRLAESPRVTHFAPHLPTLVTWRQDARFPNLAVKGAGLLAREERLKPMSEEIETLVSDLAGHPWPETMSQRLAAAERFYGSPEMVDPRCLCGLEIFETTTYRNIQHNPFASLLYTGPGPDYRSYQLDCVVQIVGEGDARYRFIRAMRSLFEHESFHFQQPGYPYGYVFWVLEAWDKSLKVRQGGQTRQPKM